MHMNEPIIKIENEMQRRLNDILDFSAHCAGSSYTICRETCNEAFDSALSHVEPWDGEHDIKPFLFCFVAEACCECRTILSDDMSNSSIKTSKILSILQNDSVIISDNCKSREALHISSHMKK